MQVLSKLPQDVEKALNVLASKGTILSWQVTQINGFGYNNSPTAGIILVVEYDDELEEGGVD